MPEPPHQGRGKKRHGAAEQGNPLPLIVRWRNSLCARESALTSTQRLVALVLSLYANPDGTSCRPTEEHVAAASGLSTRAVRSALAEIEQKGWASREKVKRAGQGWRSSVWTLRIPACADELSLPRRLSIEAHETTEQPEGRSAPSLEQPETDSGSCPTTGMTFPDNRKEVPKQPEGRSAYLDIYLDQHLDPLPASPDLSTVEITEDEIVCRAYHRWLPRCEVVRVIGAKRRKLIASAAKLAKSVCQQERIPYEPARFWDAFFHQASLDPWMSGDRPNPNNPGWKQSLAVLLREEHFSRVVDRLLAAEQEDAA